MENGKATSVSLQVLRQRGRRAVAVSKEKAGGTYRKGDGRKAI